MFGSRYFRSVDGNASTSKRSRRLVAAGLLALTTGAVAADVTTIKPASAATTTSKPFSVLLCRYKDVKATPKTLTYYREQFTSAGDSVSKLDAPHYWSSVSFGAINLKGTSVHGWYTISKNKADALATNRSGVISLCVAAAKNSTTNPYTVPAGNRVIAVMNDSGDSGTSGGRVLSHTGRNLMFNLHEMGHTLGLAHSYSTDSEYQNADWAAPGEYDDQWDLMSALHAYGRTTPFGAGGPGLNAFNLADLGVLPTTRVRTVNGSTTPHEYTLTALNRSSNAGALQLRVPIDLTNPSQGYVSVELAHKSGWNSGIPATRVLFRKVRNGKSYLVRDTSFSDRRPVASFDEEGVRIWVASLDATKGTAKIAVYRNKGYVLDCHGGNGLTAAIKTHGGKHYVEFQGVHMAAVGSRAANPAPGRCAWTDRGGRGAELGVRRLLVAIEDRDEMARAVELRDEVNAGHIVWTFVYRDVVVASDPVRDPSRRSEHVYFQPDIAPPLL